MNNFNKLQAELRDRPRTWLVTGCAGFIGSNLTEFLLKLDQRVVGLDNFSTGYRHNLDDLLSVLSPAQRHRFRFMEGDIRDLPACRRAVEGVDVVLHQAALGSVPRSIDDPVATSDANVAGFLNMLVAARDAQVKSFVYASSSATYGDHAALPKVEDRIGRPLSPYAVSKCVNELYAEVFARCYGFGSVGLRYFNVFGKRQDPNGAYAAVIPKWIGSMIAGGEVVINGDGSTTRDFCHVSNAIQANVLAAMLQDPCTSEIYNVAVDDATSLNRLFAYLKAILHAYGVAVRRGPVHAEFRRGDIRHSQADIGKAVRALGYTPEFRIFAGLEATVPSYLKRHAQAFPAPAPAEAAIAAQGQEAMAAAQAAPDIGRVNGYRVAG
ncbi:SDR family oxidoreductase [Massilia sp. 9I]|uniref:SDR family oxidoreductase n=1 Tax=Massilia sp. 9I TaxID=2653152 RepID=UPI0012F43743|nr:SDR family oxidoreductase [Massilia sp. 9I]VXB89111.1 UDP-N-acetylglucosamine 4-epimerase [Massilia sp. 9I]